MGSAIESIADVDFGSEAFLHNPLGPLRRLQQEDPIYWSQAQGAWIVTRHEDVMTTFRDERLSASRIVPFLSKVEGGLGDDFPLIRQFEETWITNVDLPIHARLRRLMGGAFSRSVVEGLRPKTRRISREILEEALIGPVDFVRSIAAELPARVVTQMFGIPLEQREQFAGWAGDIQRATGAAVLDRAMIQSYHDTLGEMNVVLRALICERRANPQEDLLTQFVQARDADDRLSEDELLGACHATIIAGFETTMHMLTLGLIELVGRPDLQAMLLSGPLQAAKVTDELLRYIGMVKGMLRISRCDFEWRGKQIRSGDFVYGMNIAANHDHEAWNHPEIIDPERNNTRSMAFGPGMHFCLGHLLAKMELSEFFIEIFSNFQVELLSQDRPYINSFAFRGLERLPVRLSRKI